MTAALEGQYWQTATYSTVAYVRGALE